MQTILPAQYKHGTKMILGQSVPFQALYTGLQLLSLRVFF